MDRDHRPPFRHLVSGFSRVRREYIGQGGEIPSYGVPGTPFKTASQFNKFSSSTGPRCRSASLGDLL